MICLPLPKILAMPYLSGFLNSANAPPSLLNTIPILTLAVLISNAVIGFKASSHCRQVSPKKSAVARRGERGADPCRIEPVALGDALGEQRDVFAARVGRGFRRFRRVLGRSRRCLLRPRGLARRGQRKAESGQAGRPADSMQTRRHGPDCRAAPRASRRACRRSARVRPACGRRAAARP